MAHEPFYTKLFADEEIDFEIQADLLSCVTGRLSDEDRESCEGPVSLDEVSMVLSNHKTPGPVEFYSTFWFILGPLLIEVFNDSVSDGELCNSMKASITQLLFKKGDRKSLKNSRPLSLFNVDYKICSKALSLRLANVLHSIVHPDQTCLVPERSISSNLFLLSVMSHYIERTNETGILISLDQEKAFDQVNRSFFMDLLLHFGFGASFCNWISTLYNGAYMRILVNDFLSDPVIVQRGVTPCLPCCIFCVFWLVKLDPLLISQAFSFSEPGAYNLRYHSMQMILLFLK